MSSRKPLLYPDANLNNPCAIAVYQQFSHQTRIVPGGCPRLSCSITLRGSPTDPTGTDDIADKKLHFKMVVIQHILAQRSWRQQQVNCSGS